MSCSPLLLLLFFELFYSGGITFAVFLFFVCLFTGFHSFGDNILFLFYEILTFFDVNPLPSL